MEHLQKSWIGLYIHLRTHILCSLLYTEELYNFFWQDIDEKI